MHGAIKQYVLYAGMRWNHLPVAGGMHDQHPDFIEKMMFILQEVQKQEAKEAEQQRIKNQQQQQRGGLFRRGKK